MSDAVGSLLVALAVVLGGTAFALGARLIHAAWRDAGVDTPQPPPAGPDESAAALRGIAAFEALKALVVLAAAAGLLSFAAHPDWVRAGAAVFDHLGWTAGERQVCATLAHWLAAERTPLLLGAAAYAGLHLAEAWGLWHLRPWGEALGAASGCVYLPFECGHLLHRPGWAGFSLLALNAAVVAYLGWRLRRGWRPGGRVSTAFRRRWPAGSRRRAR